MKKNIFTAILLIITVLSFSCSSASDELPGANIEKISNPNVNLELEDITSLGFKKNKTYKVKDLPEAKSAYYGFLKIEIYKRPNRLFYDRVELVSSEQ